MYVCTRCHIYKMRLKQEDVAELEAVFHIFTDGRSTGTIGLTELDLAMNYLGIAVDEAQLKRIFDKLDKDGVGGRKIGFGVFLATMEICRELDELGRKIDLKAFLTLMEEKRSEERIRGPIQLDFFKISI